MEASIPQVELIAKFIEKDDEIKKPYDEITVQIRQGERGVKQMMVKTSIMERLVFGLTPRL